MTKKEEGSGGIETQVPSGRQICSPDVLLDLRTDNICGSVCSPNPIKFRPLSAPSSFSSGHAGYLFTLKHESLLSSLIILLNTFLSPIPNPSPISSNTSQHIFFTAPMYSSTHNLFNNRQNLLIFISIAS